MPWPISSPQLGVGAGRPKPRKSSATSARCCATITNGANDTTGVSAFGRMCLKMMPRVGHAGGDGRADVVLGLLAVELAADVVGDAHPVEHREDDDEQPERRLQQLVSGPAGRRARSIELMMMIV